MRGKNPLIKKNVSRETLELHRVIVITMTDLPNWFRQTAEANFRVVLLDPDHVAKGQERHALQLGAYKGDASLWLLNYYLVNEESTLTDVDTWAGSVGEQIHDEMDFAKVEATYDEAISPFSSKVVKRKETTNDFFGGMSPSGQCFDFIYIDARHTAIGTLQDAVNAHDYLNVGGILAFDDYEWTHPDGAYEQSKLGVDAFMRVYGNKYETILVNYQVWLKRVA